MSRIDSPQEKTKKITIAVMLAIMVVGWIAFGRKVEGHGNPLVTGQFATGAQNKKAEEVYRNIQIFKGIPAPALANAMGFFNKSLGVECNFCHVNPWDSDDRAPKKRARVMYQMVRSISTAINDGSVTCYTCHRGKERPGKDAFTPAGWKAPETKPSENDDKPMEQVYKNIQSLKGVPAKQLQTVMSLFAASLGVKCDHCHVGEEFEKDDKPAKQSARKMLEMVTAVGKDYYGGKGNPISCDTCHRGQLQPLSVPQK